MLLSMTGFGEAHLQEGELSVAVEVRSVNSRYFKLSFKCPEAYSVLEGEVEGVVRSAVRRGTVQVSLRVDRAHSPEDYRLNVGVLAAYRRQLETLHNEWHVAGSVPLENLLMLPGVVEESLPRGGAAQEDWPLVRRALEGAIQALDRMRRDEGEAMSRDLRTNAEQVAAGLQVVEGRAPQVAAAYRGRLEERLRKTLTEYQVTLDPGELVKEVGLFAERSDISEEVVRLRSHLEQLHSFLGESESTGRKLEFLTQEMFRETNTIGSKANDVEISRQVIEMKTAIERIREMIQNVE